MTLRPDAIHGSLLGTIVGDTLGLPYEALSRRRGVRLLGPPDRHRFVFGRGMMSDDGEHACMVAQSLCDAGGDADRFAQALAGRLRWWLLGIPAGIGGATLRATVKLWLGVRPNRSGVFSAGNGPAMRAPMLGAAVADPALLRAYVAASTRLTHTDLKAFYGAMAVAVAPRCAADASPAADYLPAVRTALVDEDAGEMFDLLADTTESVTAGEATLDFATRLGCGRGVSGYIYRTVPVALHAWLSHPADYAKAVGTAIACGGDTDTVAAVTGGIVGAGVGVDGIPAAWRDGLLEWPRTNDWIARLAVATHEAVTDRRLVAAPRVGPSVLLRNGLFTAIVLAHVARRALPPY